LGTQSVCIVSNFAQALDSILAAEAIRNRIVCGGEGIEDLADEVDDGVGASTKLSYDLEIEGRGLAIARRDIGNVDELDRLALEGETRADYVALAEGIVDEGAITGTAIDRGLCDGRGLVVARFEGRVGRNAAKRGSIRISGKGKRHRRGGKVVVGSSEDYGRGI
jgi:hypothetical protein